MASEAVRTPLTTPGLRWRWYHFYFVLALIDVLVIIATLYANNRTIKSFDAALADVIASHDHQSRLNDLRFAVIQLNAPGNDIFESRDLITERSRFDSARREYERLSNAAGAGDEAMTTIDAHVGGMIQAAETIFGKFGEILGADASKAAKAAALSSATQTMAEMDRYQANALAGLADEARAALAHQRAVLDQHQLALAQRTKIERLFIGVVAFILVGVFFYGRKLQQTHEDLRREHERAESERQSRLASVGEVCFACAHGIRNPLASILTSAQLVIQRGQIDDESRSRLQNLVDSAWFLNECVTRLLTFAHAPKLTIEDVIPEQVLERAVATMNDRIRARGISVDRSYESGEGGISGDATLLTQAVIELISNAIDHTGEGGRISLVTTRNEENGGWVELGVVDNGPGIPTEVRNRACELFFTRRSGGTGIGLATVKRAAELHEGTVLLGNAEPSGADVRIRLPGRRVA